MSEADLIGLNFADGWRRRALAAEAEVERLRSAGQRCMEISTGLAAAGIVGHMNILDVMGVALLVEGEK